MDLAGYFVPRRLLIAVAVLVLALVTTGGYLLLRGGNQPPESRTPETSQPTDNTGGSPTPPGAPTGGITGSVIVQSCQGSGEERRCRRLPGRHLVIEATRAQGGAPEATRTDTRGQFQLPLRPGSYRVRALKPAGTPLVQVQAVVHAGSLVTVNLIETAPQP